MNSLKELNDYANIGFEYQDQRPPNVIFQLDTSLSQSIVVSEGAQHLVQLGNEIEEVINGAATSPYYEINVSALAGATVTWPTVPSGCTVLNPSTGVYRITGVLSPVIWNQIKQPTITMPNEYFGNWTYTAGVYYFYDLELINQSWPVAVTVFEVDSLSEASDFAFNAGTTQTLTGTPLIIDEGVTSPTYTLLVTPSNTLGVNTMSSSGTGGTSSFNGTTKVLTIVGTKTQVNSHLNAISLTSASEVNFNFTYSVSNNLNAEEDSKLQRMLCNSITYLSAYTQAIYWNEDIAFIPPGVPTVTDTEFDGSGSYTYVIQPSTAAAVSTISATGSGGSTSFNASTKALTITGTRTQVNSYLSAITVTPTADYALSFFLNYSVVTPRGASATATKAQQAIISFVDVEVTNIAVNRRYYTPAAVIQNFPFSNTTFYTAQSQFTGTFSRQNDSGVAGNTDANAAYIVTDGLQLWNQNGWLGSPADPGVPKYGTGALQIGNINSSSIDDKFRFAPATTVTLTGDFTVEGWFLSRQTGSNPIRLGTIFDTHTGSTGTGFAILAYFDGTPVYDSGGNYVVSSPFYGYLSVARDNQLKFRQNNINWIEGTWYHIAVSRQGSTCRVFVNGAQIGSFTDTGNFVLPTTGFGIGSGRGRFLSGAPYDNTAEDVLSALAFRGYVDNFVISRTARYTTNFAPAERIRDQDTVYVFNMNGTNTQWPPVSESLGGLPNVFTQVTPQITDTDTGATYTIRFACASSLGAFSYAGSTPSNNFTFSGTRAQCNQVFANLRFHPVSTVGGNVTYTQQKNAVTQVTQTILFQGVVSASPS